MIYGLKVPDQQAGQGQDDIGMSVLPQAGSDSDFILASGERQETHSLQSSGTSRAQAGHSTDFAGLLSALQNLPEMERAKIVEALGGKR
jgi:hypothetical protein